MFELFPSAASEQPSDGRGQHGDTFLCPKMVAFWYLFCLPSQPVSSSCSPQLVVINMLHRNRDIQDNNLFLSKNAWNCFSCRSHASVTIRLCCWRTLSCFFIYCVSFRSLYLFKLGLAPQIQDLYGKVDFTGKSVSRIMSQLCRLKSRALQTSPCWQS